MPAWPEPAAGSGQRDRFERVKNQAAGFAAINLFIGIAAKLLQSVRQHAHAAAAALPIAGFGEASTVVAFGDARIEFAQILGNRSQGVFAFGDQGFEQLLFLGLQGFNLFFLFGDRGLVFLQIRLGVPNAALGLFARHHHFQLRVFGFGDFRFGVGNFMLQSFVGLVGFDGAALVAIFLRAIFPLLDVQLEFLPLFLAVDEALFGRCDSCAGTAQFGVGFLDALRKGLDFGTHGADQVVDALQLDQVRNGGMHGPVILTQGTVCFARRESRAIPPACGMGFGRVPQFCVTRFWECRSKEEAKCRMCKLRGSKDERRR